jgi:DNA helicase HerA-like ATPase
MQQVKMVAGITAKIGRFLFSASAKRILEQPKSTINFDEILNGKILICNFSKGLVGEDTSELFGIAVLAKLQLAALRRARLPQKERIPFYLYVDEFQNFATPSFTQMLSEARKYKLFLTMAEQSTSQQDDTRMVDVILANVGTVISFRSGNPSDEKKLLPYFKPYLDEGDIVSLPSFNFYMRISAVKIQEAFSGETLVPAPSKDVTRTKEIIELSRQGYAMKFSADQPALKTKNVQEKAVKSESVKNFNLPG